MKSVDFKELKETWGSEYEITEGEFKGYRIDVKMIVERLYPLDEMDVDGLPRFRVSHHSVTRVRPPKSDTT